MQLCLTFSVLVLQAEVLVRAIRYLGFIFQTTLGGVFAVPQQIATDVGHLFWNTDLVAVVVVSLLAAFAFFNGSVVYLCQGFVGIRVGVEIGISAVELCDQLVNAAAGIDFGEQQPCAEVGRGYFVEDV
ncbi:hypothetical protein [Streptococcus oralis]|uniref:hypothetical protein n=1 Tax=Streptococcus sp. HJ1 TaxID=3458239 RepID=UPI000779035F